MPPPAVPEALSEGTAALRGRRGRQGSRGGRAIRVRARRVETAVWTLTHPSAGRVVTLVGVMHIGDPAYFEALSGLLAGLAASGGEVHVEGISRRAPDDLDMTPWERERLAEAAAWADPERAGTAVEMLRLDSQGARLRLPEGTRNIDLSDVELLRAVGWDDYRRLLSPPAAPALASHMGVVVRTAMRFQLRHGRAIERVRAWRRRNRRIDRVVIGRRNRWAFDGAVTALGRGDVVLVWGTDHLPGLAAMFRAKDYCLEHEAWFEACRI